MHRSPAAGLVARTALDHGRMLLPALTALGGVAATRVLVREHGVHERELRAAAARGDVMRVRQGWVALPSADPEVVGAVRVGGALTCTSVLRRRQVWTDHDHHLHVRVATDRQPVEFAARPTHPPREPTLRHGAPSGLGTRSYGAG